MPYWYIIWSFTKWLLVTFIHTKWTFKESFIVVVRINKLSNRHSLKGAVQSRMRYLQSPGGFTTVKEDPTKGGGRMYLFVLLLT